MHCFSVVYQNVRGYGKWRAVFRIIHESHSVYIAGHVHTLNLQSSLFLLHIMHAWTDAYTHRADSPSRNTYVPLNNWDTGTSHSNAGSLKHKTPLIIKNCYYCNPVPPVTRLDVVQMLANHIDSILRALTILSVCLQYSSRTLRRCVAL